MGIFIEMAREMAVKMILETVRPTLSSLRTVEVWWVTVVRLGGSAVGGGLVGGGAGLVSRKLLKLQLVPTHPGSPALLSGCSPWQGGELGTVAGLWVNTLGLGSVASVWMIWVDFGPSWSSVIGSSHTQYNWSTRTSCLLLGPHPHTLMSTDLP